MIKKKFIAILLALSMVLIGTAPVYAADLDTPDDSGIELQYEAVSRLTVTITIQSGIAYSYVNYQLKSLSDYDYELILALESSTDKNNWEEVMSWTTTPTSRMSSWEKKRAIASGCYYRTVATLEVYTKSGTYVESAEETSVAVYY